MNATVQHDRARSGLTLIELLVAMAVFAILAVGLQQIASQAGSSFVVAQGRQELLANGRFAMDRIVAFIQESDMISIPASNRLVVSERRMDIFDNQTHAFAPDGDGLLDADNNGNGLLNDNYADQREWITFSQSPAGDALLELPPDHSQAQAWLVPGPETILCRDVKSFACTLLSTNLVEIQLTLADGQSEIFLQTRALARLVKLAQ